MTNITSNTGLPQQVASDQWPPPALTEASRLGTNAALMTKVSTQNTQLNLAAPSAQPQPNNKEVTRVTEELQRRVSSAAPELQFSVDHTSGRSVIRITDPSTNEVIRQIPSEEALQIAKGLDQFQKGLLLHSKA
ncbi:MAG: flagellar protein FlaG [Proteobacteria bacterium]|nr:flagellar protein FlaG [Pseudomonadota bacterium]